MGESIDELLQGERRRHSDDVPVPAHPRRRSRRRSPGSRKALNDRNIFKDLTTRRCRAGT